MRNIKEMLLAYRAAKKVHGAVKRALRGTECTPVAKKQIQYAADKAEELVKKHLEFRTDDRTK